MMNRASGGRGQYIHRTIGDISLSLALGRCPIDDVEKAHLPDRFLDDGVDADVQGLLAVEVGAVAGTEDNGQLRFNG